MDISGWVWPAECYWVRTSEVYKRNRRFALLTQKLHSQIVSKCICFLCVPAFSTSNFPHNYKNYWPSCLWLWMTILALFFPQRQRPYELHGRLLNICITWIIPSFYTSCKLLVSSLFILCLHIVIFEFQILISSTKFDCWERGTPLYTVNLWS
jgi:hypothetical protein